MEKTKTGAIVCKKPDAENQFIYEALLFINGIPNDLTDSDFKAKIILKNTGIDISSCSALLYRADIHSTSNEVQEQFENLHSTDKPVPQITFNELLR
ncbi:MAG: hypothetical protein ABI723_07450 [Bacteroidia bacterium]